MRVVELERYIESLTIGQGRRAGQLFELLPWQRRHLRGAFRKRGDSSLSIARANGKTTYCAALCAAALDGPLVEPMGETLLVASSFGQGLAAFRHVKHFLSPTLDSEPRRWRIQDSANRAEIRDNETGALLRVLGSDPRRLHGAAPKLLLLDEIAQWPTGQIDAMLAALTTSRGKQPNARALWIGTRPNTPDHPFSRALDGVGMAYVQAHGADADADPFEEATWRAANPSWRFMPDLRATIKQEAEAARIDASALAQFRAYRLNLGVPDTVESVLLEAETWERIEGRADMSGNYALGVDMGTNQAMSASAAYWPDTGALRAFAVFPELPALAERGRADAVGDLYEQMAERGELLQRGRRVSDVSALLSEALARWGVPGVICCDRWRVDELRQHLDAIGFPHTQLTIRGMGFKDGAADVRGFLDAALRGQLTPEPSLLLRAAMSEARVVSDAAGNRKLAKKGGGGRRQNGKDDAVAAAILAVAEGRRRAGVEVERAPRTASYAVV